MKMSNDIKISPKYGLNPTIPICFFCGEPKNEIALMGKMGKHGEDIEAPKYMVLNYEPCDHCKEQWNKGVPIIECVSSYYINDNRPNISTDPTTNTLLYPTDRWCVLKADAVQRVFNIPNDQIQLGKPILVSKEIMDILISRTQPF